ncbi:lysosomal alpha-mannosidase isoform X2 [Athalia rosae]|uniref:lysosomal alpha-mannosidase isoform X2 n=1 Tax=Athalia rosae TaxID=37344 RepID=UPI00203332D9|nr:lysosomal alpha-mannosidase isoform X2 [Athalia rosae]
MARRVEILTSISIAFLYFWTASNECHGSPLSKSSWNAGTQKTCGYQSCQQPVSGKLNVHVVPHTHDDVGWLKTVDQYYWGSRSSIAKAGVQYILDSVIRELLEDPKRRFIYVETSFLWKWWLNQNDETKSDVQRLIDEGRLEIISGAWSMNDEATTHYQSIIDQFTWGLRRLNDTFGSCARPHVGWQIDPFGHSREQASIFARMGFDGLFFGRLDYQDKSKRLDDKTAEMIWKGSDSLGKSADLFTNVLYNNYSPPPGFCFDVLCDDEPVIDDVDSPDYNVNKRVGSFLRFIEEQSKNYRSNNIILTMGGDFTYQDAEMWYKNLDKLVRYTNELNGSTVNVFYSTPSCYLKAVNDLKISLPTKSDDFFPYASDPHTYWTGYFTSRPAIKFYERMGNNVLQTSKQLAVLGQVDSAEKYLVPLREAMGVMQHHDAVTGTEKQHVAQDYARILYDAIQDGDKLASVALGKLVNKNESEHVPFNTCHQLNVSACPDTENNENFVVTLYNPQSRPVSTYVRLPVPGKSYSVRDFTGALMVIQIVPIPSGILSIPGRESSAINELVFRAVRVPALGYQSYHVTRNSELEMVEIRADPTAKKIKNQFFEVTPMNDGTTHTVRKVHEFPSPVEFKQSFHYYEGWQGNNAEFKNRSSGAYIFRPRSSEPKNLSSVGISQQIYKGPLVQELHTNINEWVSQVVRVYQNEDYTEWDWVVGPIPVEDKIGKEFITRYSSVLDTRNVFYTDSNGREMLRRERDFRPTWSLNLSEPVAGNYYPVTAKITLKDKANKLRLSVLNDRAQGGTSLNDGQIELMLHRRLLHDDAFGVGEALDEKAYGKGLVVRGRHFVIGGPSSGKNAYVSLKEKELAWNLLNPLRVFVSPTNKKTVEEWRERYRMQGSGMAKELPSNVRILTLEPWKDGHLLLRLEHIFEVGEDTRFSHPVEVNIKDLFSFFAVTSIRETTLGGNQWLEDADRLEWISESNEVFREEVVDVNSESAFDDAGDTINILLRPMEIRTFVIKIALK